MTAPGESERDRSIRHLTELLRQTKENGVRAFAKCEAEKQRIAELEQQRAFEACFARCMGLLEGRIQPRRPRLNLRRTQHRR